MACACFSSYKYPYYAWTLAAVTQNLCHKEYLLLDAGCGGDNVSINLEQAVNGAERVAVDLFRTNLKASRNHGRASAFVLADITYLPFKDGTFDGVLCVNVIEHIENKSGVVSEFARTTRKGGFFVGCSTNLLNPLLWMDSNLSLITAPLVAKFSGAYYGHRHKRFSPSSLNKTLRTFDYSADYWIIGEPQFYYTNWYALLERLWFAFNWLTKSKPFVFLKEMLIWKAIRI